MIGALAVDTAGDMTVLTVFLLVPVLAWWAAGAVKRDE